MSDEIAGLRNQIEEKEFLSEQNCKNMKVMKDELAEQLKIAKTSELALKRSLEKLQKDFQDKENVLKSFDDKFKLAEESLKLFYMTVKHKEDQINLERL
jgi:superfamily II helicase